MDLMIRFLTILLVWGLGLQRIPAAEPAQSLPDRVWASREAHKPIDTDRMNSARAELRSAAQALEDAIGGNSSFAQNWKKYLLWDYLSPHFDAEFKVTGKSLGDLDQVLRRFRKNKPGLEFPQFIRTAAAIERYREIAFWFVYGQRRDPRPLYEKKLQELEKQLTRNLESPTVESERQVGLLVGVLDDLGYSPSIVQQVRKQFNRPNVALQVSEKALNRLGNRPVNQVEPVLDCILGARVRGTACSQGGLTFCTYPCYDQISVGVQLAGYINSNTKSYKKPVVVSSTGRTNYVANKQVLISDDQFLLAAANADASTKTRTRSVRKTGGKFGRRIVERIARKKVAESKSQSERIAARHAEERIENKFDAQMKEVLNKARGRYENELRPPLVRVGMFPDYLRMSSDSDSISVEATLASYKQISTGDLPPQLMLQDDLTVQLHETAINNFLPILLSGVMIQQESEEVPPTLKGEVPDWLKKVSQDKDLAKDPTAESVKIPNFKPWSFKLNETHPVSVSFDDQKLTIRIRIAQLITIEKGEEQILKNWDLIIAYRVIQDGNGLLIQRDGPIQVLPTGFDPAWFGDPRWKDKLSGEQVGIRRNLEKNLNKRAEAGGFPSEIKIPAVKLPKPNGVKETLVLQQFDCDDGWLTLGYRLP